MDKGASAFDLRHGFKVNYINELPSVPAGFDYSGAGLVTDT